jgi:hypothetical protein
VRTWPWQLHFRNLFTEPKPAEINLNPAFHYIFSSAGIYAAVLSGERWVFVIKVLEGDEWMLGTEATSEQSRSVTQLAPRRRILGMPHARGRWNARVGRPRAFHQFINFCLR